VGVMDRITPEDEGSGREQGARGAHLEQPGGRTAGDRPYLDRVVTLILQGQISKQEAYLHFLATAGNITPFIGLFGTVIGIINAFQEIGKQGTANIAAVAPGVAEALVATAAGLFAAIPAVIAYNYYLTQIRRTAFRVESFSLEFLNSLDSWVKQVGVRA
jgi:biopolymer transport protein TolQ